MTCKRCHSYFIVNVVLSMSEMSKIDQMHNFVISKFQSFDYEIMNVIRPASPQAPFQKLSELNMFMKS